MIGFGWCLAWLVAPHRPPMARLNACMVTLFSLCFVSTRLLRETVWFPIYPPSHGFLLRFGLAHCTIWSVSRETKFIRVSMELGWDMLVAHPLDQARMLNQATTQPNVASVEPVCIGYF